jgi:hypothetical protein
MRRLSRNVSFVVAVFLLQFFLCSSVHSIVAQDTVIEVPPGIWWVNSPLVYEGTGSHDNFVIKGSGPASRIALTGSATITIRNMSRWSVHDVQIVKVSGSTPVDFMVVIEDSTWGTFKDNFVDGFGLAAGVAVIGSSGGNWFDNNKILDVTGLSSGTRGIGIKFDIINSLDNKVTNTVAHPFGSALGDSMLAIIGSTAGFFVENFDSNPCKGCWTIDIDGVGGVHRESQIVNVGTALPSGNRGAIRVINGENIVFTNLIIEGNGAVISDHLLHLDCLACKVTNTSFNNIHTTAGFDFFHPYRDRSIQFIGNTGTRSTIGREFIYRSGLDEVANRPYL